MDTVALHIQVRPSPETDDHEVLLFGDEQNLVERFGDGSMGLDPDDLLREPCPLLEEGPRDCLIGRCGCGCLGCGDVHVKISIREGLATWSATHGPRAPLQFALEPYAAEVKRALADHTWETPERTASRLLREGLDYERLRRLGMTFAWASGRVVPGLFVVALHLEPGPYQVLVRSDFLDAAPPRSSVELALALLSRAPSLWPDVEWLPQAIGLLLPPPIAGPGWRRWSRQHRSRDVK